MSVAGTDRFAAELEDLGYKVSRLGENRLTINYRIGEGRFQDRQIKLGFEVPTDFELSAPGGPHISPRLIPINPSAPAHPERSATSSFGDNWQYLSRPFHEWSLKRTVKRYLEYVAHVLNTL